MLAALLAGCTTGALELRILDAETIELNGEPVGWSGLREAVEQQVAESRRRKTDPPLVIVQVDPTLETRLDPAAGSRPFNRLLDLLQAAGVRRVDVRQ